jgi:hypothetical protein
MKARTNAYLAKVDPCYGFTSSSIFFRRLEACWRASAEDDTYDIVLAGVAALGLV